MSQISVERVIGALVTDERLRLRFTWDPRAALADLVRQGAELTPCEQWALTQLDPVALARFADEVDGRLQKTSLDGGGM
jgi:hypothetical protein